MNDEINIRDSRFFDPQEVWKPILNIPIYLASNLGRIKSIARFVVIENKRQNKFARKVKERIIKPGDVGLGYLGFNTCQNGEQATMYVHRAVLLAFVGPPNSDQECCHADGDRSNNNILNLRWGTHSENLADKVLHGTSNRGEASTQSKLNNAQVLEIRSDTRQQKLIAADYKVSRSLVGLIKAKKVWRHV